MNSTDKIVVLVTTDSEDEAKKIADILVQKRKAACVNIMSKVDSTFWWQGKIDSANECLLIVKSKASLLSQIIDSIKEVHSNEVPEIIALPIVGGNNDYLKWIDGEVKE